MGAFDDIRLEWAGKAYTIPANRVLGAIARIEDVVTLNELQSFSMRGGVPLAKISRAFGAALRYAGAQVGDDEIYQGMFQGDSDADTVVASISALVAMMIPPASLSREQKETAQGNAAPARSASSQRPSRSGSVPGTKVRKTSGR